MAEGIPVSTYFRQISDKIGTRQWDPIPGRRAVKPVSYIDYRATDAWWQDFIGYGCSPVIILEQHRRPLHPDFITGAVPLLPEEDINDFGHQAFLDFDTQIKEEFQPLDFLSSLTQLKDLIPKLSGSLVKDVASGYLTYEFGWKNFIQDIGHLTSIVQETEDKLQALKDTWGKEEHLVRRKVFDSVSPSQFDHVLYEPRSGYAFRYRTVKYKNTLTVGTYRFHQLEGLDHYLAFTRAALVALGFGSPLKAIWDAIPFTFILEWFTNIGQTLSDANLRHLFSGVWELRHPCTSQKVKATVKCTQEHIARIDIPCMPTQVIDAGEIAVKRYERNFGFPLKQTRSRVLELSPKQLLLLAALGTSRGSASW